MTERRLRLLFLSHSPKDPDGGASRIYHMLEDGLAERGHFVTTRHLEDFQPPNGRVPRILVQRMAMPHFMAWRARRMAPASYDVIMSSSGIGYRLFRALSRHADRPAFITHIHGLTVYDHAANLTEAELGHWPVSWPYRLVTGPFQVRWDAEGIAAADRTIVQNLRDYGHLTSRPECQSPVSFIPAAVHPSLLEASACIAPVDDRAPAAILWFASWEARKGSYYVPGAFRRVRDACPEATLTIGGAGAKKAEILAAFDERDRSSVRVLPRISVEEQIRIFNEASIFLFPSLSEGFGLALLEAMCFGLASVTTNTGFGGDFLDHDATAKVVYPSTEHIARAIIDLIERDTHRRELAHKGRLLARTFTPDRMFNAYERTFLEASDRLHLRDTGASGAITEGSLRSGVAVAG